MTVSEAMQSRHSVRKYIDKPIEESLVKILQEKVNEVNAEGDLHIQLVTNEPKAFKGKMAYGVFSGVSNYFVMVGRRTGRADSSAQACLSERVGYYGEQLVLPSRDAWAGHVLGGTHVQQHQGGLREG